MKMEVICLESKAFYELVQQVTDKLMEAKEEKPEWISGEEAMNMLKITSKTTLQRFKKRRTYRLFPAHEKAPAL